MASKNVQCLRATNAQILNAIRNEASYQYNQNIPPATQGDISATMESLNRYRTCMNEFVDTLINRIGDVVIKSKVWDNPLAQFKRGMMNFGDTIEELQTDLIRAHRYDPNSCYDDVFACAQPVIHSNFHQINRQDWYPLEVNDSMLRRAFLDDYGLQDLVGRVMETPYTSDHLDEYMIMRNLFAEMAKNDGFYKVQVPDASAATTRADKQDRSMAIVEAVRSMTGKLKWISREYNAAKVPTFSKAEDLVLFATPDFLAMLDVNVLAFAFNVSAAEIQTRIIELDDFGVDGCQAILADRDIFMCADTLIDFESIRNPKSMSWHYYLHHHGIYSMSRFVSAVMFTTEAGTSVTVPAIATTGVTVAFAPTCDGATPTSAEAGQRTRFTATVAGTIEPETEGYTVPQGVIWKIASVPGGETLAPATFIDAEGVLHVDINETAAAVVISATSTYINPFTPIADQVERTGTLTVPINAAAQEAGYDAGGDEADPEEV